MNYYFHQIKKEARYSLPLLEKDGILSTGWRTVTIAGLEGFSKRKKKERNFHCLKKFVNMQIGDWVLVSHPHGRRFSIYEVTSALMDPTTLGRTELKDAEGIVRPLEEIDMGFFFKVKVIAQDISRSEYLADGLARSMRSQWTTLNISKHEKAIRQIVESIRDNNPINHQAKILEELTQPLCNVLKDMTQKQFKELIQWYFTRVGASSVDIGEEEEDGIDFVVEFEALQHQISLQIHRTNGDDNWLTEEPHDHNPESAIVENFSTARWVISQSAFNDKEREIASANDTILVDSNEFAQKLLQAGLNQIPL